MTSSNITLLKPMQAEPSLVHTWCNSISEVDKHPGGSDGCCDDFFKAVWYKGNNYCQMSVFTYPINFQLWSNFR